MRRFIHALRLMGALNRPKVFHSPQKRVQQCRVGEYVPYGRSVLPLKHGLLQLVARPSTDLFSSNIVSRLVMACACEAFIKRLTLTFSTTSIDLIAQLL